jgi:hypothetical protein
LTQVFASRVDGAGFVDYEGVFGASGGDACALILRRYFLSTLPVVAGAGRSLEQGARSLTARGDEERRALQAFCSVLEALVVRAEGRESGQLERAIAQAEDSVVLALATAGASRLRDATPQERQDARREFAGLLAFTRSAMNG